MDNIVEEKVLEEKINKIVQEAYVKGIQYAQEELESKEYLSYKDVREIYNISRNTINKWVELGLPMYKIDKLQFIKRSEINNFIDSHQV